LVTLIPLFATLINILIKSTARFDLEAFWVAALVVALILSISVFARFVTRRKSY